MQKAPGTAKKSDEVLCDGNKDKPHHWARCDFEGAQLSSCNCARTKPRGTWMATYHTDIQKQDVPGIGYWSSDTSTAIPVQTDFKDTAAFLLRLAFVFLRGQNQ